MKAFASLTAVVALWLGVSMSLWFFHRLFRNADGSRQKRVTDAALALVEEGAAIFSAVRARASQSVGTSGSYGRPGGDPREAMQDDVRALLNTIETKSAYFDRVKAAKAKIEKTFGLADFAPLAEILQIRRDFWAASEIFLIEDIRALGAELTEPEAYETFKDEALALLFKDEYAAAADDDAVALRLSLAREEAAAFKAHVEESIAAKLGKGRAPTLAEFVAVPLSLLRSAAFVVRESGAIVSEAAATAHSLAHAVGSKGLKAAAGELRKARGDLPGQFAHAFERAGGLARIGGDGLKRHYEFLLEARELRARYAEFLARAPILTEKGKQFLARLELEKHAEQVRESSGDAADWTRRGVVMGIASLIRALQYVQAKITPQQNKRLAVIGAGDGLASAVAAADQSDETFRALLPPASSYAGGNRGKAPRIANSRGRKRGNAAPEEAHPAAAAPPSRPKNRLRDTVTGEAEFDTAGAETTRPARSASSRRSNSLLDRLATIDHEDIAKDMTEASGFSSRRDDPHTKRGSLKSARH